MTSLADIVVIAHAIIAAFITLGFVLIPLGGWLGWQFVRQWWLRFAHLVGILFVAGETALGFACPLTLWEDALRRESAGGVGFIAGWVRWILYYDVPLWIFGVIYIVAGVVAVLLWRWVPPAPRRR
jgi:hypothetical protein